MTGGKVNTITKIYMIPVALCEAVVCGVLYGMACFWDFWDGGHFPFKDKM